MNEEGPAGVAVIGTGRIAREHVAALAALPGLRVLHVVGGDLTRARSVAALATGAAGGTDFDAALTDPLVQAVDVCGYSVDHARRTVAAGRAGKHVLVEKPAALNLADLDEMITATGNSSLLVGQTVRFQPAVALLREQVAAGAIGTPRLIHITWYAGHVWPGGWRGWQLDPNASGGHPVHNGTHAFDLLVWLTGRRPQRVFARAFPSFAARMEVPDSFHVTVRMDDGSLALIEISYALRRNGDALRRLVVTGTTGTLVHSTADDPGLTSETSHGVPASVEGAFNAQMRHWLDVVTGSAPAATRPHEIRAALAGSLAAQQSLTTARPVAIGSPAGSTTGGRR